MKTYVLLCLAAAVLFVYQPLAGTEKEDILRKEQKIYEIEKQILEFETQKKSITERSESLALEVQALKKEISDDITPWERFKLEDKLKQSQELSGKIKLLNRNIEKTKDSYKTSLQEIISLYNEDIKTSAKQHKENKKDDSTAVQVLEELYKKRAEWKMKIEDEVFNSIVFVDIDISPFDGPREIDEIADMLMDNYEGLQKTILFLEKKRDDLIEEKEVREAVGEFVEEIILFEEREKGLEAFNSNLDKVGSFSWANTRKQQFSITRSDLFRLFDKYDTGIDDELKNGDINSLISKYNTIIDKLKIKSEETKQKAQGYYKMADGLRDENN
ncbi:hypothetical protein KAS50_06895 [bacterium]|nr:hypothetical protein [bacterium]